MIARDGVILAFGDAHAYGSTGAKSPRGPLVAVVSTPGGLGLWVVANSGKVFSFGNAHFYGSRGTVPLKSARARKAPASNEGGNYVLESPIVAMAPTSNEAGYYLLSQEGQVYAFGDAHMYGSALGTDAIGIIVSGDGYWVASVGGQVLAEGNPGPMTTPPATTPTTTRAPATTPTPPTSTTTTSTTTTSTTTAEPATTVATAPLGSPPPPPRPPAPTTTTTTVPSTTTTTTVPRTTTTTVPSTTTTTSPGPADGSNTVITASPASVPADGTHRVLITVRAYDSSGNPLSASGGKVTLSSTIGSLSRVSDNRNGTYSANIASLTTGTATISGTIDGNAIRSTATVRFAAP